MCDAPADSHVDGFLRHLTHERRLSPHTLGNYRRDIERIRRWLDSESATPWEGVNQQTVRRYVAWRHRAGASGKTLQRELSSLRSLYRYLLREGVLGHNPAQGVRAPKSPRKLPSTLDADQL